jgi:repressor LexA
MSIQPGDPLTERQNQVLTFIKQFIQQNGYSPTVREIGAHFGIQMNGVMCHIRPLEAKGALRRNRDRSRGFIPVGKPGCCPVCGHPLRTTQ